MRKTGGPDRSSVPLLVLGFSLLLSVAAAGMVASTAAARDEARFRHEVDVARERILSHLSDYATLLRGGAAFMGASEHVDAEEFAIFVRRLRLAELYPGIQGVGFTARVRPEARDSLIAEQRIFFPDFRIWPETPPGEEEHTIAYLHPPDRRNRAAIGFNMYSEEVRRAAMSRARDRGGMAMSGRVRLVQEIEGREQAGFLIYVPVFPRGVTPESVEERRAALLGFIYAPFRADDLFQGILGSIERHYVAFRVFDGTGEGALLHDSAVLGVLPAGAPRFRASETLRIADHTWTVAFTSTAVFEEAARDRAWLGLLLLGLAASLVLSGLSRRQSAVNAALRQSNLRLEEAHAEADRARAEADHANRAKGDFLAAMSHELRTPLNAITGYADLLDMEVHGPITPQQRRSLDRIRRSQAHLVGLIDEILSYARLEAGKVEVQREAVPLRYVLNDLEVMTEPQLRGEGLSPTFLCEAGAIAMGDADKIRQILLNLLSNAIKFTPHGGRIDVHCRAEDEHVLVDVADTGRGIPADRLPTIFDPFIQLDRNAGRDGRFGVGLGLAISRDLSELMGGALTVESEPGRGSVFTLRLPRAETGAGAADPPTSSEGS
jgi:signal transduction histidine kinase